MVGKTTTEGDRALHSNVARKLFNINGRGITIGVITDHLDQGKATADIATGDLPGPGNPHGFETPVQVLQNSSSSGGEGRATLQVIFDIAPGAKLLFHSSGANTEQDFATAVQALTQAGANVIVDNVTVPAPLFQDGVAAQAAEAAVNQGIVFVSAIGNDTNRSYQSAFRPGATFTFEGNQYEAQNFDTGSKVDLFEDIQRFQDEPIELQLGWDQPIGHVTSDLDMFLMDSPHLPGTVGNILAEATVPPFSANEPLKLLNFSAPSNQTVYLVIAHKVSNPDPPPSLIKWISVADTGDSDNVYQRVNDGSNTGSATIYGQPNAAGVIAVGAVPVNSTSASGGKHPKLEPFSDRGGTPILFDQAGDRLATPEIRHKPEVVAPDRVSTSFSTFTGTSAAAPHVAAIAALMLQRAGGPESLTPAQILTALQNTAVPIGLPGNFSSGAGLVQADSAVLQSFVSETMGTAAANTIQGKPVAEDIYGLGGKDRISGEEGSDAVFGGVGNDQLEGNAGNDYLVGGAGNDILKGGQGDDYLLGSQGEDLLIGEDGNDFLNGGTGKDTLVGGLGKDTFMLNRAGFVLIRDFQPRQDKLDLSGTLEFSQLNITQQRGGTVIKAGGDVLAKLDGVSAPALSGIGWNHRS